jgi:hypothetical protein
MITPELLCLHAIVGVTEQQMTTGILKRKTDANDAVLYADFVRKMHRSDRVSSLCCLLSSTLLLETGVVGVTGADAGEVVAWPIVRKNIHKTSMEEFPCLAMVR